MIYYLDTNIVIYTVENDAVFGPKADARLAAIQAGGDSLMISDLTRMECLVGPLKSGDTVVEGDFLTFFTGAGVQIVGISASVCDRAARIRATTSFKPMDALQLAAAVEHGADVFLTNDHRLDTFTDVKVEVLT